jgi:hypothetical protein
MKEQRALTPTPIQPHPKRHTVKGHTARNTYFHWVGLEARKATTQHFVLLMLLNAARLEFAFSITMSRYEISKATER